MTDEKVRKRPRVKARRKVAAPPRETRPEHPIFWVQCFGCGAECPQILGPGGKAYLPDGWVTIFPSNRRSRSETPDVYASDDCIERAVVRTKMKYPESDVTVVSAPTIEFVSLSFSLEPTSDGG